jgi:hypothetical protein
MSFTPKQLSEFLAKKLNIYSFNAYIGDHFFSDATTAVFSFTRSGGETIVGKKSENVPAPATVNAKEMKDGMTTDAVDWLKIAATEGTTNGCKTVYRVVTAGGKPPATCEGQGSTVEVAYATEYCEYPP